MITRNKFKGNIDGKELQDYKGKIDWLDKNFENRRKTIDKILNLNQYGTSDDVFWQDVWDCGICKTDINTSEARWEETDVAKFLETMGSYLLYGYQRKEKRRNREVGLNENLSYDDISDDKNYRLAPPDKILSSDYRVRNLFLGTYEDYINKVKSTPYEVKSEEVWNNIKRCEEEKVKLLKEAKVNLDILKGQMEKIKNGETLQFNKEVKIKRTMVEADINLSKQLRRVGLDDAQVLELEEKIKNNFENMNEEEKRKQFRYTNVTLKHLQDNLSDMNDYMLSCKLAYTNRVMIKPNKCPTKYNVLEIIDYLNTDHIKAMLSMGSMKLDPSKDMAVIAYDINKKVKEMYSNGELSDRDLYIIEGMQFNVSNEKIGKELGITGDAVGKTINRICDNIVKSFYEDHMDLYFLNESKGHYKKCSRCGEIKLTNQFDKNGKKGLRSSCKRCESERKK